MKEPPGNVVATFQVEAFEQRPAFKPMWAHECPIEEAEYLVQGLIPRLAYALFFARRGGGKSFLITDLAMRAALGMPFLGFEIPERFGSVIFVGEKKARFGKRLRAWLQVHEHDGVHVPVLVVEGVPNLLDPTSVDECIAFLNETARPQIEALGVPLEAAFFDTLARCIPGGSVSDQAQATTVIEAIQRIVEAAKVAVIPTAHIAKAAGTKDATAKGAGEWEDAADAVVRIEREGFAALRTITNTKQSDGPEAPEAAFTLKVVEVGRTKRGRPITSCVVEPAAVPEQKQAARIAPPLSADAQKVIHALGRMVDEGQVRPMPNVPLGPKSGHAVLMRELRPKAYDMGLRSGEKPDDETDDTAMNRWKEARKKAFERAVGAAEKAGKLRREGEFVWPL